MTEDKMSDQDNSERRYTKADLLERIEQSRKALADLLRPMSEEQMTQPIVPGGWSIKDHLAHIAEWEIGIADLLRCRPRFPDPEVAEAVARNAHEDEINELFYKKNANLSLEEAMEKYEEAHNQLVLALEGISDDDLYAPYDAYLPPDERGSRPDIPVMDHVAGNSFGHIEEHIRYIQEQLG